MIFNQTIKWSIPRIFPIGSIWLLKKPGPAYSLGSYQFYVHQVSICIEKPGVAPPASHLKIFIFLHPSPAQLQSNELESERYLKVEIMEDLAPNSSER